MSAVMSASVLLSCPSVPVRMGGVFVQQLNGKRERERERKTERSCRFSEGDRRGNNPFYCRFLSCRCEGSEFGFPLISRGNQIQQ